MGILWGTPSCDVLIKVLDFNPYFRVLDLNPNVFTNNAR